MDLKQKALEVQAAGKNGDIHLIHVNERELAIIKTVLGFEGTVNDDTGLLSFDWTDVFSSPLDTAMGWGEELLGGGEDAPDTVSSDEAEDNSLEVAALNNAAYLEQMKLSADMSAAEMEKAYELAIRASERVEEKLPDWRKAAGKSAAQDVPWLNRMITSEFEGALDRLYPSWREDIIGSAAQAQQDSIAVTDRFRTTVMPNVLKAADEMSTQAIENSQALLRGEVPQDVQDQILRTNAELSYQIGVRGQAQGNLVARDLGLTSLQMQEAGLAQSQQALSLGAQTYSTVNQTLQMPVTTGVNVTNAMAPYRAPITDPAALYGNYLGILSGQGAISPNTVLQTSAQTGTQFAQLGANQSQFNTQLQQQSYWNQMNYGLGQQAIYEAGKTDPMQTLGQGLQMGASAATIFAMSDRRLKRNIQKLGTVRGINVYEWDYVWGEHSAGVMADEVPWASVMTPSGYYAVDYSKVFA